MNAARGTGLGIVAFVMRVLSDTAGNTLEHEVTNATEMAMVLGAQLRRGFLFGGVGWQFTSVDGAVPVLSLSVGATLQREEDR